MLVAKGYSVSFYLPRKVSAPGSYAMLHDPSGKAWPELSVLVAPFSRGGGEIHDDVAESYFGYVPKRGSINLPPKALREWAELGPVEKIEYTRTGDLGGDYFHHFDGSEGLRGMFSKLFGAPSPVLFKRGRLLRLEMPNGSAMTDRGFEWP